MKQQAICELCMQAFEKKKCKSKILHRVRCLNEETTAQRNYQKQQIKKNSRTQLQ